ncbi:SDR family oxidoreductase [Hoyosella altamirensis]|uniref:NAD(P)-dependent dehydrogenase (Short-subunit alcohol dehydrogenase family) n=1 Tax=Hoyosella altamirensis TaxID=616997 RepID=A0A839RR21_9ACTN|nr:SDR family oxidoreductase [Hoyosella altamirensis]MBB3038321.1 NAD(P)-dependent dehydrogenase (short-subunit alcohol dehydrogenase family) [Hoyosella altamirensis]
MDLGMPSALKKATATFLLSPPVTLRGLAATMLPGRSSPLLGKNVLITGASSGVGAATAELLADHSANVLLVARNTDRLKSVAETIRRRGGSCETFSCDVTDEAAVTTLVDDVIARFGTVDVLVNNAGRSIRRSAEDSVSRFHDYERTMALNYFGAARLTLALLPSMLKAGEGHIINVATWGVHAGSMPMFTAYHASKAAITAFGRSIAAESRGSGVHVTTVQFPLIRTPMIAPTKQYESMPALTPRQAASWILTATLTRPVEIHPRYAAMLRHISLFAPTLADAMIRRAGI